MKQGIYAAMTASAALTGCISAKSSHVDYAKRNLPEGMQYAAPKGLLRIELWESAGELFLAVSEPFFTGDPDATFVLDASSGLLASQEYLFVVDPRSRLLAKIDSVSEGQAAEILKNLGELAGAVVGAPPPIGSDENELTGGDIESIIYTKVIDPFDLQGCDFGTPCDFAVINAELRARAQEHLECWRGDQAPYVDTCAKLERTPNFFEISLDPLFSAPQRETSTKAAARRCSDSICYRAPVPYSLGLRIAGVTDRADMVLMPNEAPVLSLNLPAGVFANASARVELINGMPTILSADKDNEIVAATAVPLAVLDSFLSGVSRVVQFRINYGGQRTIADAGENTNRSGQLDNRDRALELDERERELEEREQAFADMFAALSGDQASATASGDPAPDTRPFAFGDVDENSLSGGDENSGVATDAELSTLMQNLLKTQPNLVIERAARPRLFTVKLTDHTTANSGNSGGLGGQ